MSDTLLGRFGGTEVLSRIYRTVGRIVAHTRAKPVRQFHPPLLRKERVAELNFVAREAAFRSCCYCCRRVPTGPLLSPCPTNKRTPVFAAMWCANSQKEFWNPPSGALCSSSLVVNRVTTSPVRAAAPKNLCTQEEAIMFRSSSLCRPGRPPLPPAAP